MGAKQYRLMLGALLVWALVPLPFLYIVLPPFWMVAGAVGLLLCLRPGMNIRLNNLTLNLIGVGIIVAVVIAGGLRVGPLRPLGHLLLLLTSVRALLVKDRSSFLRALLPVFLVWVVAVASSTHFSVILYFAASAGVWWWAGMRTQLDGVSGESRGSSATVVRPRHAAIAAAAALVLAIPLFLAMPRLHSPWIAGRGGPSSVTGFTSQVDLASVGPIRQSHEIALIVRSVSGQPIRTGWMRLRATALERVTVDTWTPQGAKEIPEVHDGLIWPLGRIRSLEETVELEVELLHPRRYLFLPEGTVALAIPVGVRLDPAGGVVLASRVRGPLRYSVWVAGGAPPRATDRPLRRPRRFSPPPEVRRLAQEIVANVDSDEARAAAVEAYLRENYGYSMSGMARMGPDPVTWFLLHQREGHCEYFAGAMVALLNDLGIPARMISGYSGGSLSAAGDEAVVREMNAHTWVEAWVGPDETWTVFDPTPEGEIPALDRPNTRERLRWAWEWTESRWDRYVLTFGLGEQIELLTAAGDGVGRLARGLSWRHVLRVLAILVAAGAIGWLLRRLSSVSRRRSPPRSGPAAEAMARMARRLEHDGMEVPPRATVRWIANHVRARWPGAGAAAGELAWLAERELYSGGTGRGLDRAGARRLWARAKQGMKR